jgi:hypothetical protein
MAPAHFPAENIAGEGCQNFCLKNSAKYSHMRQSRFHLFWRQKNF